MTRLKIGVMVHSLKRQRISYSTMVIPSFILLCMVLLSPFYLLESELSSTSEPPQPQLSIREPPRAYFNRFIPQEILSQVLNLRHNAVANHIPCGKEPLKSLSGNQPKEFDAKYSLKPVYTCGEIPFYFHPHTWESHLKGRLFDRIRSHNLTECTFVGLDVGAARGDWAIAVGVQHSQSNMVVVEANPTVFQQMTQDIEMNHGLTERVFSYNAAVKSDASFFGFFQSKGGNTTNTTAHHPGTAWNGPKMCVESAGTTGVMITNKDTSTSSDTIECTHGEVVVPILTVDVVMSDYWTNTTTSQIGGNFFFAKLDIEGAEYDALLGAKSVFSSEEMRPCYVYIEIKVDSAYDRAFHLLKDMYGYAEYQDIDSGLSGDSSYPPRGAKHPNEGNYEFRLPAQEMEKCVKRVRKQSCH